MGEKNWIKVAKNTTHNFHLKNRQTASSNALKSTWTPQSLKDKEKRREMAVVIQSQFVTIAFKHSPTTFDFPSALVGADTH